MKLVEKGNGIAKHTALIITFRIIFQRIEYLKNH